MAIDNSNLSADLEQIRRLGQENLESVKILSEAAAQEAEEIELIRQKSEEILEIVGRIAREQAEESVEELKDV